MDNTGRKNNNELASEIMPDGLVKERSAVHGERFCKTLKKEEKQSTDELSAKSAKSKV